MNAQTIVKDLTLSREDRQIYQKLAELYDSQTPTVLYLDYYELANGTYDHNPKYPTSSDNFPGFPNTTPAQWESFLDIPEIFRYTRGKIAKLQEFAAVKAMKRLEGDPSAASLKELIKTSKSLASGGQREKIIMTYVRPKAREVQA